MSERDPERDPDLRPGPQRCPGVAIAAVEIPEFPSPLRARAGGEDPVLVLDLFPDLAREPRGRHRRGIPVFLGFFAPASTERAMMLADLGGARRDTRREARIARDTLAAKFRERRDRERRVGEQAHRGIGEPPVVHRPLADVDLAKADIDPFAVRRVRGLKGTVDPVVLVRRPLPVAAIKADDQIGVAKGRLIEAEIERMFAREVEARIDVDHGSTNRFGEHDQIVEAAFVSPDELGQQHRPFGGYETICDRLEQRGIGGDAPGDAFRGCLGQRDRDRQRLLLQPGVIAHVDRALGLGHHDRVGAGEAVRDSLDAPRLIVPLGEIAHRLALHVGGVDPVDERPAPRLVHRTGRADDEDRRPIDVRVVDAHDGVQHPDDVVHDCNHRLSGDLRVPVGDLDRDLLVLAQHHRRVVLIVIDQGIMQAPVTCTRVQRDVREAVRFDQVGNDV